MRRNEQLKKIGLALLSAAFWVGVWALCAVWVGKELFLPTPLSVLRALGQIVPTADFWKTVGATLLRIVEGYLPGIVLGVLGGVATAKIKALDVLFSPLLSVIKATPVSSFIILALVFFGRNTVPALIVFLMVLPIMWANVAEGVKTVDPALREVCRVYSLPFFRRLRVLYLPHCRPYFSAGALTALGFAWKAGVAAEVLSTPKPSVGKMVYDAKIYLETPSLFAWTLVVVLLSLTLEKTLKFFLERGRKK